MHTRWRRENSLSVDDEAGDRFSSDDISRPDVFSEWKQKAHVTFYLLLINYWDTPINIQYYTRGEQDQEYS